MPSYLIDLYTGDTPGSPTDANVRVSFSTGGVSLGSATFSGEGVRLERDGTTFTLNTTTPLTYLDRIGLRLTDNSLDDWYCTSIRVTGSGIVKWCRVQDWVKGSARISKPVVDLFEVEGMEAVDMVEGTKEDDEPC